MSRSAATKSANDTKVITICGIPNSGKTTIFNAITGLRQSVANYPGVTVEKVTGKFTIATTKTEEYTLIDIPGTYSLTPFSPDERIATAALCGLIEGEKLSDAIVCVVDATNLERGLSFIFQILQIGRPVVVALNMIDLAEKQGLQIDVKALSKAIGGIPVVPLVATEGTGIASLKAEMARATNAAAPPSGGFYDESVEQLLGRMSQVSGNGHRHRAELLRSIFDEPEKHSNNGGRHHSLDEIIKEGRAALIKKHGSLSLALNARLGKRATEIAENSITRFEARDETISDTIDKYLLHPLLGPLVLAAIMVFMFQSIFSWAEPLMNGVDYLFGQLSISVGSLMAEGPLRSLLTDGIIGGVGSVIIFLPQIVILFLFISVLEDSGYLARAAFMVDKMFHWCGLSGKSFIPLLTSYACAIPGIMATRTIEDRKLRLITIMVAPLMTCSARLPVYAIMIAAFIPYQIVLGVFNLQGLVLTALYVLGLIVAIGVSFVLKTIIKSEQSTFMMEMPSYKRPTLRSVATRVLGRTKSFLKRAGTIIAAITIVIWALSYYPRSDEISAEYDAQYEAVAKDSQYDDSIARISNEKAGAHLANSYFGRLGRVIEPLFEPLGWDWKITLAALASFPAREVVVATLGTVYNLGSDTNEESLSLVAKLRGAVWDHGEKIGQPVFNPAVAISIMVFFALCCQCGATLVTIKQETGKMRYPVFVFVYMTTLAYAGSWLVYKVFDGMGL